MNEYQKRKSKYAIKKAKERERQLAQQQARRIKIFRALRTGQFKDSTLTHTVNYNGTHIEIPELQYMWLDARGPLAHTCMGIIPPRVTDTLFVHPKIRTWRDE